jgi:hypothetical protein
MRTLITIFTLVSIISCDWLEYYPAPTDFAYHPPAEPVEEPVDTIPVDTIVPIDTCMELIEYTTPAFVTLYMKFDEPQDTVLWEGGGIQSYDLKEVVQHITGLQAKVDTSPIGGSVLLLGTNNHTQFQLKIFARIGGYKWYMGTATQSLILPGSDAAYYKAAISDYPSFDMFSFFGSDITCEQGIGLCREVLKDCHAGRWYADLFYLPCQPPQTVRDSLDLYGWERIRASKPYRIDLRGKTGYNLNALAATGAQIIVKE